MLFEAGRLCARWLKKHSAPVKPGEKVHITDEMLENMRCAPVSSEQGQWLNAIQTTNVGHPDTFPMYGPPPPTKPEPYMQRTQNVSPWPGLERPPDVGLASSSSNANTLTPSPTPPLNAPTPPTLSESFDC